MARLANPRPSSPLRESSIYRDPTPDNTHRRPARRGPRPTALTSPSDNSDKENRATLDGHPLEKGRNKMAQSTPPTPTSESNSPRSNKRRRLEERSIEFGSIDVGSDVSDNDILDLQYYDPDQDEDLRREVRKHLRKNARDLKDRRDELMQPENDDLKLMIDKQNRFMSKVRQTTDATIDSRFMVDLSDLALKKSTNLALGDTTAGVDVDEFVSKCIAFMRIGGPPGTERDASETPRPVQARRSRQHTMGLDEDQDDDDEEDDGDALNWEVLGELACIPNNRRPALPGFLLGPLSVQKRIRQSQPRAPRLRKELQAPITKPQELQAVDLQKAENSNLTTLCKNIKTKLEEVCNARMQTVMEEATDDMEQDEVDALMRRHLVTHTGGIPYLQFVVNPKCFGQTVENMFYISFLIRDGSASLSLDEDGGLIIHPTQPRTIEKQREQNISKHQAIFSLDYPVWETLIKAFDIREPVIPHRNDDDGQRLTAQGWYG